MNRKTTYLIPAFAAVFALMFAFASPLAMAEPGEGMHDKWMGKKHHKMHKVIEVEGFVGSIQITEDVDKQTLKDQITVSLSEAANGLDVIGGHIGVVINENGDKYLVWTLKSIETDLESETAIATIYVVDAGDANNTTTVTKEFDRSVMEGKYHRDGNKSDKIQNKIDRFSTPTGDAETDALRAEFVSKLSELRQAYQSGDSDRVEELKQELQELRNSFGDMGRA